MWSSRTSSSSTSLSSCTHDTSSVSRMQPIHTERTNAVSEDALRLPLDRPPDHAITLTSDRETDIQSTTDDGLTAVFRTGAGEHNVRFDEEMRGIVAVRLLHASLPQTAARLALRVDSTGLLGSSLRHTVTEVLASSGDGTSAEQFITTKDALSSFEFPLASGSTVRYPVNASTGRLEEGASPSSYNRSVLPSDIPPLFLSAGGQYGRNISTLSLRWLDAVGDTIPRVRKAEAYRTLRLCMPPKVMLMKAEEGPGDAVPANLSGMYITPHAGGAVYSLSVTSGGSEADRGAPNVVGFSVTVPGDGGGPHTGNPSQNGRGLVLKVAISENGTATVLIDSPGLGFASGDQITIYSSTTLGYLSDLRGVEDLVLTVGGVSAKSPVRMLAGVVAYTPPKHDIFAQIARDEDGQPPSTITTMDGDVDIVGGTDSFRRKHVYTGVSVGDPYVRYATETGIVKQRNASAHPDFPLTFDIHVDGDGDATVVITSMGGGYESGNYIHVDAGFFMRKDHRDPTTVNLMWKIEAINLLTTTRPSVKLATTPAFVMDYKWIRSNPLEVGGGELRCSTLGDVLVDGVALSTLAVGDMILVQSFSDQCTTECIELQDSLGQLSAATNPAQYNTIYKIAQVGTATRFTILVPLSTSGMDQDSTRFMTTRIPVERGQLHGGTYRVPDLTAYYVAGNAKHYRQALGPTTSDGKPAVKAALVELSYFTYERNTWVPTASPSAVFCDTTTGSQAFVDVYASRHQADGSLQGNRPALLRPIATRLQIGGGGAFPNGTVRDTLALMTSPYAHLARPVMHLARVNRNPKAEATVDRSRSRDASQVTAAAVEELYTVAMPPRKRQPGFAGPAPPRTVGVAGGGGSGSGLLSIVDVDIVNKREARPTTQRIEALDTTTVVGGDTHNDALRMSRKPHSWVPNGVATWERMHTRGVAGVMKVDTATQDEVGIMPWSLTLGFYKSTEPRMRN